MYLSFPFYMGFQEKCTPTEIAYKKDTSGEIAARFEDKLETDGP